MISPNSTSPILTGFKLAAVVAAVELLIISAVYKHGFDFTCREFLPTAFCAFAGRIVPRALGIAAALVLFALARPDATRNLLSGTAGALHWLGLNLVGLGLILTPWLIISDESAPIAISVAAFSWSLGGLIAALGLALMLAPGATWARFLKAHGPILCSLIVIGAALPELADVIQGLWRIEAVTDATFHAVVWALQLLGYPVFSVLAEKAIGVPEFYVYVGPQCSGVEGFALITVFLAIYMALYRKDLRFPRVLMLFPIGIALSWCFNVLRIAVLLVLGIQVSPDLAVGGFHSHAGWLSFTLLSTGMIYVMHRVSYFHLEQTAPVTPDALPPLKQDPVAAMILPFVAFMLSGLLASTFAQDPATLYPARALIMVGALICFKDHILALPWRLDGLSVAVGVITAILWVSTAPARDGAVSDVETRAALGGALFVLWVATRVIGTSLLVPLIEELFFRGYLLQHLAPEGKGLRTLIALLFSAVTFSLLHDRMLAAGLAGLAFGLLVLRSGKLTDAIIAHGVANAGIATWALYQQDFAVI